MPRAPRSSVDFAQLPTEAPHPRAAKLDTMAPEAIAALMLAEEAKAVRAAAGGPAEVVCCIAASGTTPFVRAALDYARFRRAATILVTCTGNPPTNGERIADVVIALETGPEVIAGSTRLKAGTATKITLNAMSTTAFVLLGKTYGGLMIDVRPTNAKLWARAIRIVRDLSGLDETDGPRPELGVGR